MGLITGTQQSYYDSGNFGGYQFTSLNDVIDNFMATYIGSGKLLENTNRADVTFHAMRAMQELSFDTFKSCKAQEMEIPPSLVMPIPQDYVNYVELSWSDSSGIKHIIYPTSKTSNPTNYFQNSDGGFKISTLADLTNSSDVIVLDKQYDNILVGMLVKGVGIAANTIVQAISTFNGVTTITLSANVTTPGVGAITDATITFEPLNGGLIHEPDFQISQYHAGIQSGQDYITFFNNTTFSQIDMVAAGVEIGMLISSEHFPIGTSVVNIDNNVVYVSNAATSSSGIYDNSVVFTSTNSESDTWSKYKASRTTENNNDNYVDDTYWPMEGSRYGLDPQHAQTNGSYYIDCNSGLIHFSSNLSGKTVILDYISDSLGTNAEMQVHKFAEEAIYKWIAYGCLSAKIGIPEYIIKRFKKEKFAETRKAKLRLSNIKLEEITQILRGKSKQIKH